MLQAFPSSFQLVHERLKLGIVSDPVKARVTGKERIIGHAFADAHPQPLHGLRGVSRERENSGDIVRPMVISAVSRDSARAAVWRLHLAACSQHVFDVTKPVFEILESMLLRQLRSELNHLRRIINGNDFARVFGQHL